MDFRGAYEITPMVTRRQIFDAGCVGVPAPSDKPCYRITGPGEFEAIIWSDLHDAEEALRHFLLDFFGPRKMQYEVEKVTANFDYETIH